MLLITALCVANTRPSTRGRLFEGVFIEKKIEIGGALFEGAFKRRGHLIEALR